MSFTSSPPPAQMDSVVEIKQDENVWGLIKAETEGSTELAEHRQKYKPAIVAGLSSLTLFSPRQSRCLFSRQMVFNQKKSSHQRYAETVWTWWASQIKAKPFCCSFYSSRMNFGFVSSRLDWTILFFSLFLHFLFVLPFIFQKRGEKKKIFQIPLCLWKFWTCIRSQWFSTVCWCVGAWVCEAVCVSQLSVDATAEIESWGKESRVKASAGHHQWEQTVWRTWLGLASLFSLFFFYLTLDLSAVWNFLFVPEISPEISCQSHCVALHKLYLSLYR